MITITRGNLIEADTEALVNTVNCVGYMGKGIALQFKKAFPENFKAYQRACRTDEVQPGAMCVFPTGSMLNPKYIINFPTKRHWRGKSRIEDIQSGLRGLVATIRDLGITSVAVPPLGCGLGGLEWDEVRSLIENSFVDLPEVGVLLFEPAGAPDASDMPVRTKRPQMTVARALFLRLMHQYAGMAYRLTLLEMQKLAYLLQEAGEPLRLRYEQGHYGPYAHNLNKVLDVLEGHFIQGYGDSQKPDVEIEMIPGAAAIATSFLAKHPESATRLNRVAALIEGFETPYGMELLSSVHWLAVHATPRAETAAEAASAVHGWNARKRTMFKREHIHLAWEHLKDRAWLPEPIRDHS